MIKVGVRGLLSKLSSAYRRVPEGVRDVLITILVAVILIVSLYAYTQNWPPLVVIESGSMRHSKDSQIGVIDAGDMVLVKKIHSRHDVVTYVEGRKIGYVRYGGYGDVIIYRKNGYTDITPVIHRAIVWVEYNDSSGNFDAPDLGLYNVSQIIIDNYFRDGRALVINLSAVPKNSGFITMGDNNGMYDQAWMSDGHGRRVGPIMVEWVVGKAVGEIPWFGGIKLYLTDKNPRDGYGKEAVPDNSWRNLKISIIILITIPITADIVSYVIAKRKKKSEE